MGKKITFNIVSEKQYKLFKQIYCNNWSDSFSAKTLFEEYMNLFLLTTKELNIFTKEEAAYLMESVNTWLMKFHHGTSPAMNLISEVEDYFKYTGFGTLSKDFREKLEKLSNWEAYVLCRILNSCRNTPPESDYSSVTSTYKYLLKPELYEQFLKEEIQ